jgi:hypothetical protein
VRTAPGELAILIHRKSRVVMKDAVAVLDKAGRIHAVAPDTRVILETTAPVCSKSIQFLEENGICVVKK